MPELHIPFILTGEADFLNALKRDQRGQERSYPPGVHGPPSLIDYVDFQTLSGLN